MEVEIGIYYLILQAIHYTAGTAEPSLMYPISILGDVKVDKLVFAFADYQLIFDESDTSCRWAGFNEEAAFYWHFERDRPRFIGNLGEEEASFDWLSERGGTISFW